MLNFGGSDLRTYFFSSLVLLSVRRRVESVSLVSYIYVYIYTLMFVDVKW